jgi:DNA-binding response OmpR family regulator
MAKGQLACSRKSPPDGFETCRLRISSHLPVIFMTGLSETGHVVKQLK